MKKLLTLIALFLVIALASAGEIAGQLPNAVAQLEAVDATGKKVGPITGPTFIDYTLIPTVTLELNGRFFSVGVALDRLIGAGPLYYPNANCTGAPHIPSRAELYTEVASGPPGNTIYVGDPTAVPTAFAWSSVRNAGGACGNQSPPATQTGIVPAVPLLDASTLFTPPYKTVARVVISDVSPSTVTGGGATIKITGSGFSVGSAGVTFNGIPGSNVQVINDSVILVTVPGGLPAGPVTIGVTTAGGGSATLPGGPAGFSIGGAIVAIPALTEWGLILMGLCLLGAGIYFLRWRQNYSVR